ncbi:hypothetical protein ES703_101871 [subsurface metagenome]
MRSQWRSVTVWIKFPAVSNVPLILTSVQVRVQAAALRSMSPSGTELSWRIIAPSTCWIASPAPTPWIMLPDASKVPPVTLNAGKALLKAETSTSSRLRTKPETITAVAGSPDGTILTLPSPIPLIVISAPPLGVISPSSQSAAPASPRG